MLQKEENYRLKDTYILKVWDRERYTTLTLIRES